MDESSTDQGLSVEDEASEQAPGSEQTPEQVMETLVELLTEVVGEDYLFDMEITGDTSFATDLELESIEFVALSEKLQQRYANQVDFVTWMGDMGVKEIMTLRVGQLTDHIVESLGSHSRVIGRDLYLMRNDI